MNKHEGLVWWCVKGCLDLEMMRVLALKDNCESLKKAKD